MLEVDTVRKRYGEVEAVRGLSFGVAAGEVVGLLGMNGAGKSTVLNMVAGLLAPDAGSIRVGGHDVHASLREGEAAAALVGYAAQATALYPSTTVRENLEFFGRLEGMSGPDARERAAGLVDRLGLRGLADTATGSLSGGERRRTHIGAAMMHSPALLILDEPSVGMDVQGRVELLALVDELAHREGTAICFSSHYITEVEQVCDRVVVLHHGEVLAEGTVAELVARYAQSSVEFGFAEGGSEVHTVGDLRAELPGMVAELTGRSEDLASIDVTRASLESAFLRLTGERSVEQEGAAL